MTGGTPKRTWWRKKRWAAAGVAVIIMAAHSHRLPDLLPVVPAVLAALGRVRPGDAVEVPKATAMFGFFRSKPTCPVHPVAKAWVEGRLGWLFGQFGPDVFLDRPVVLPSRDLLPDGFDYSDAAVRRLLDRVCDLMGVDPREVDLEMSKARNRLVGFVNEQGRSVDLGFGGLYEGGDGAVRTRITIDSDELCDLAGLIGTIAHELAHHRLMGERRIDPDVFDNELLTDLTVVFHGLGVLKANSPRNWPGDYTEWPGTTLKKPEYMTEPLYGYALAHAAWLRGEDRPAWAGHLIPDVRVPFRQGLRYLHETGDSPLAHLRRT